MNDKPRLFIGSSSEEIQLANKAKEVLSNDFEVIVWNYPLWDKGVFKLNNNFLNDLLKASLLFDLVLMIGTRDDKVEYRGKEVFAARDNVIFELGLFLGRMGISKCAFLVDWDLNIPTDLKGISLAGFTQGNISEFENAIKTVSNFFKEGQQTDINFFPSSTLASVYYENFILPVCSFYTNNPGFTFRKKNYNDCLISIIIPEQINTDVNIQFEQLKKKVKTEPLTFHYAGRPRNIHIDVKEDNNKLEVVDFPTIIGGINYAIMHLLPEDFHSQNYKMILQRELKKFCKVLLLLIHRGGFDKLVCLKFENEIKYK
jgi:hypothetical protein